MELRLRKFFPTKYQVTFGIISVLIFSLYFFFSESNQNIVKISFPRTKVNNFFDEEHFSKLWESTEFQGEVLKRFPQQPTLINQGMLTRAEKLMDSENISYLYQSPDGNATLNFFKLQIKFFPEYYQDQILKLTKTHQKNIQGKIAKLQEQITAWEKEVKNLEEQNLRGELNYLLFELQRLSLTYAQKHPKISSLLPKIRFKYQQLNLQMPDYDQLLLVSVQDLADLDINQNLINKLNQKIKEAKNNKIEIETTINNGDPITPIFQIKPEIINNEFWQPSKIGYLLLFFLAGYFFLKNWRDRRLINFQANNLLKEKIKVDKVYSFPTEIVKTSNQKKLLINHSHYPAKEHNTLPAIFNSTESTKMTSLVEQIAIKIMINAQDQKKKILFFASTENLKEQVQVVGKIAVQMSKYANRVLMVDGSSDAIQFAEELNLNPDHLGFSDYLLREASLAACLQSSPNGSKLKFMTSGMQNFAAQKVFLKPRFSQVLRIFVNNYDYILFCGGTMESDLQGQFLAKFSDQVFLIANNKSNTLAGIQKALLQLRDINLQPEAVILQQ